MNLSRASLLCLAGVLLAGATYQLLYALRALPTGDLPGAGPAGQGLFGGLPTLALLVGSFGCFYLAGRGARPALAWLVAPLAAAFMVAHYYSYDDYCGGYGCRIADEAATAWRWVWGVAAGSLVAGAITWRNARVGLACTGAVGVLCALTVFFVPFGH
jgi:hypothetical protein